MLFFNYSQNISLHNFNSMCPLSTDLVFSVLVTRLCLTLFLLVWFVFFVVFALPVHDCRLHDKTRTSSLKLILGEICDLRLIETVYLFIAKTF